MSDDESSQNIKQASDDIVEGLGQLSEGIRHISRSIGIWFEDHPLLKLVILAPVSAVVGNFILRLLTQIYVYFFGQTVVISRDVRLEVFPAPIGFSLWVFLWAFILFVLLSYFKFVALRQRLDELESRIDS